jgi:hypothetical protein
VDVPQQKIDSRAGDEQEEHRLAKHLERDGKRPAPVRAGQRVRSVRGEALRGFGATEPTVDVGRHGFVAERTLTCITRR